MQFEREKREIWLGNSDFRIQLVKISHHALVATSEHDLLLALISGRFSSKSAQSITFMSNPLISHRLYQQDFEG